MEKSYITQNGIRIYNYPNTALHSFCLCLYIKAGPLYEVEDNNGISHFLEHVLIRNVNHLMDKKLYKELDMLGLSFNACTYKEVIQVIMTGSPKNIRRAIEIFSLIFHDISLPSTEINIERNRIKAEIREDDDKDSIDYFANKTVWAGTPLQRSITGTRAVLDKIGKKKLVEEKRKLFVPDNIFIYTTGNVSDDDICYLSDKLNEYSLNDNRCNRRNEVQIPTDFGCRRELLHLKKSDNTAVRVSFDFDSTLYSDATYVLLFDVLFEGDSCKMFQQLSEATGIVYSYTPYLERYNNIGNLSFSYEIPFAKLYESLKIVASILSEIKTSLTDELKYVVAPYTENYGILFDNPEDFNWTMAYESHILNKNYTSISSRVNEFAAVTPADVMSLANIVFTKSNLTVSFKGNRSKVDNNKISEIFDVL